MKNNENINLRFKTTYEGKADLVIVSNAGQRILRKLVEIKSSNNILTIEIKSLIHGSYFIILLGPNGEQIGNATQFIKQ